MSTTAKRISATLRCEGAENGFNALFAQNGAMMQRHKLQRNLATPQ
jgi:hypothetical protein